MHVVLATEGAAGRAGRAARHGIAELASAAAPGIFLQGLLVYGQGGLLLASAALDPAVVQAAFEYSGECPFGDVRNNAVAMCHVQRQGVVWRGPGKCSLALYIRALGQREDHQDGPLTPPHLPKLSDTPQTHTEGRCVPFLGTSA